MAIIPDIINCGSGNIGTWFDGCKVVPKDLTKLFLLSPAAKIDLASGTFDEEDRALLIKKGQLVALNDALQIMDTPAKNNVQTFPNKNEIFISQGLYKFQIQQEANTCLVKALHKLAKKKWGLLILDSEGKLFFDNNSGFMQGFEVQMMMTDNETVNDGGSKVSTVETTLLLSKNGTVGYNERKSFLISDEYYGINGIQDVKISAPILAHATLKVKVVSGCDGSSPVLGLETANFQVVNAGTGVAEAITVAELSDGEYNITGATAGARVIELYDTVNHSRVADIVNQQFYQSNILAVTLT